VHEVVHPEKDSAVRLARRLARRDVVDYLPLLPGYSITEIKAPPQFVGKSLRELALRNRLNVQLIAIERPQEGGTRKMSCSAKTQTSTAFGIVFARSPAGRTCFRGDAIH
jgi:Trk K+ transport system NAD-binding subunit